MRRDSLLLPVILLSLTLAACDESPVSFAPAETRPEAVAAAYVTEPFDRWDPALWLAGDHALGRGYLRPANLSAVDGMLRMSLPAAAYDGAELQSSRRFGYGVYEARLRAAYAPGSLTAFFLYQGVRSKNDEVDIEIFNDGTRRIMFTTWAGGRQTHNVTKTLPFDPAAGFHVYRIDYQAGRVAFSVDGVEMQAWTDRLPRRDMYLMANAWWPTWLSGSQPTSPALAEIDWIRY